MHPEQFKILVADKDADFRRTVQVALKTNFRHVSVAETGPQVLSMCERNEFALVIIGNHLPGMLGIEVVRRLEKDHPRMVRMLTSEHDTDPVIESALEYGIIDRFLQKPLDVRHLVWETEYLLGLGSEPPHPPEDDSDVEEDDDEEPDDRRGFAHIQTELPLVAASTPNSQK